MAQDYAKLRNRPVSRNGKARAATRTPPAQSTHWPWYFAGVVSGLFAVFVGYIGIANFSNNSGQEDSIATVLTEDDLPIFNFEFYEELANASVDVTSGQLAGTPDSAVTTGQPASQTGSLVNSQVGSQVGSQVNSLATTSGTPNTAPTQTADMREYLLQAGSFQDQSDAESRRAKIILLNMNANVVPGVVAGRKWMRVQVGPFNGRLAAESARAILSENNIDSIPLIVR